MGIAEIPLGGTPTYSITPSTSSIDEKSQSSVRFNFSTTDVDTNTRLYYTASGSGIDANDFSSGDIKSSRLIGSDGKATFVLSAAADKTTEGPESFNVKLYSDFQRTNLVATSTSVSIADTSKNTR
jgi:prolyl oligopeptidase PreP (S9A serine peptidase family)